MYVVEENENTLTELKSFQNYVYRHFKKHEKYKEMRPTSSQPARIFTTAKTNKFTDIKQINVNDLKLRPIIDQTGTHLHDCLKIIAQYLQKNEEYVSYDVESLFTSIPLGETIDIILDEIYV